jgi:NAD(P)H-dependent flavin oxidoreductase YrpB (nitropropane dioxygenase family)
MPAGQGIGGIHDVLPAGEIVARLVREARAVVGQLDELV